MPPSFRRYRAAIPKYRPATWCSGHERPISTRMRQLMADLLRNGWGETFHTAGDIPTVGALATTALAEIANGNTFRNDRDWAAWMCVAAIRLRRCQARFDLIVVALANKIAHTTTLRPPQDFGDSLSLDAVWPYRKTHRSQILIKQSVVRIPAQKRIMNYPME